MKQKQIKFVITGNILSYQRHRTSKYGKMYDPIQKEKNYIHKILVEYLQKKNFNIITTLVALDFQIYKHAQKNFNKAEQQLILTDNIKPYKKPDIDNIYKVYMDIFTDAIYIDDAIVYKLSGEKHYIPYNKDEKLIVTVTYDIDFRTNKQKKDYYKRKM